MKYNLNKWKLKKDLKKTDRRTTKYRKTHYCEKVIEIEKQLNIETGKEEMMKNSSRKRKKGIYINK